LRLANTVGAAITNRRVLGSSEAGILLGGALVLLTTAGVAFYWPRALAWPLALLALWLALGVIVRYIGVVRTTRSRRRAAPS